MPLRFGCPCGRKFNLKDSLHGKKIRCPKCESVLRVPSPKTAAKRQASQRPIGSQLQQLADSERRAAKKRQPGTQPERTPGTRREQRPAQNAQPRKATNGRKWNQSGWLLAGGVGLIALGTLGFLVPWGSFFGSLYDGEAVESASSDQESPRELAGTEDTKPATDLTFKTPTKVSKYCSVKMPGPTSTQELSQPTAFGPVNAKMVLYDGNDLQVIAAHTHYSDQFLRNVGGNSQMLLKQAGTAGMGARRGSQIVSEQITETPNGHQLDLKFTFGSDGGTDAGTSIVKAILNGQHMHVFSVNVTANALSEQRGLLNRVQSKFFDSIQLAAIPETRSDTDRVGAATSSDSVVAGNTGSVTNTNSSNSSPELSTPPSAVANKNHAKLPDAIAQGGSTSVPEAVLRVSAMREASESSFTHRVELTDRFSLCFPIKAVSVNQNLGGAKMSMCGCPTPYATFHALHVDLGTNGEKLAVDPEVLLSFGAANEPSPDRFDLSQQFFTNSKGIQRHDRTFTHRESKEIVAVSRIYSLKGESYFLTLRLKGDKPSARKAFTFNLLEDFFGSVLIESDGGHASAFQLADGAPSVGDADSTSPTESQNTADASADTTEDQSAGAVVAATEDETATETASSASDSPSTVEPAVQRMMARFFDVKQDIRFKLSDVPVPSFPSVPQPYETLDSGESIRFVQLPGDGSIPGDSMSMRIYFPADWDQKEATRACVLLAPAGTNLLRGNDVDQGDYHEESLPYLKAGMAVVLYSIDGPWTVRKPKGREMRLAYEAFKDACAGVVNARNALDFVLQKIPQVDPKRIYSAGHSSAATLSLLFAEHEERLAGCLAYAPTTDVEENFAELLAVKDIEIGYKGLRRFVLQSSPLSHLRNLKCPTFLFHPQDDQNVPLNESVSFATIGNMLSAGPIEISFAPGSHYQGMIDHGIPRGIIWLRTLERLPLRKEDKQYQKRHDSFAKLNDRIDEGLSQLKQLTELAGKNVKHVPAHSGKSVVFQVLRYSGNRDAKAVVNEILLQYDWLFAKEGVVDLERHRIYAPMRIGKFSTGPLKAALEKAGFEIGLTGVGPTSKVLEMEFPDSP